MTTTCPSCKAPVQPQDARCPNCGMRLTQAVPGTGTPTGSNITNQPTVPVASLTAGGASQPSATPLQPGTLIAGRYRLEALVGKGAMGEVWRGRDEHLAGRVRAIKRVLVAGATSQEQAEREAWLKREADILASLNHPAICDIFDVQEDGGSWYLVLEWIEGRTLAEELAAHGTPGLPEAEVLGWAATLCSAFALLHSQQPPVIFRDLKPQNIMLRAADRGVKLIDFGIARSLASAGGTTVGTAIGTPGYAPPEQYQGKANPSSDQYALAATLHHLLTGRDPTQHDPWDFPPARALAPTLSPRTEAALARALSMKASDRFPSIAEFAAALSVPPAQSGKVTKPAPRRAFPLAVAAALIAVVLVALGLKAAGLPAWLGAQGSATATATVVSVAATSTLVPVLTATPAPATTQIALRGVLSPVIPAGAPTVDTLATWAALLATDTPATMPFATATPLVQPGYQIKINAFYTLTKAAFDAWSSGSPAPKQTGAFPTGTADVAYYVDYQGMAANSTSFQVVIYDHMGAPYATGMRHTFPYAAGQTLNYFGGGAPFSNGTYRMDVLVNGIKAASVTFTVGLPSGMQIKAFYSTSKLGSDLWSAASITPVRTTTFATGTTDVAYYISYQGMVAKHTHYQVMIYNHSGAAYMHGRNFVFPTSAGTQSGYFYFTDQSPFADGTYRMDLLVNGVVATSTTFTVGAG